MPTITEQIINSHLVDGRMVPGEEIALKIDQTLTQDATGTMAYLEFEAMGVPRVRMRSRLVMWTTIYCRRILKTPTITVFCSLSPSATGYLFPSRQRHVSSGTSGSLWTPGKTLLGSDSHTPTGGGLGMLAIGAGGFDVALAMAGQPFYLIMPEIIGVRLTGKLPPWVSAKDVILELLRGLTVKGGVGKILEYFGPGVANSLCSGSGHHHQYGSGVGATTSLFPSDITTKRFLASEGEWQHIVLRATGTAGFKEIIELNLNSLTPKIACPSSPDNVKDVSDLEGLPVHQVAIGSCSNSSIEI